jgi:hypothetical protein
MGRLLKVTEVTHIVGPFFTTEKSYALQLTRKGLGCVVGDFFSNSSGHPEGEPTQFRLFPENSMYP